ncbi:MAG TPA: hypothetical protein VFI42_19030 [Thermomicrobiaceae bacterium]|nr:hypothetical protein [Thermomicrobiaceae bacterium]
MDTVPTNRLQRFFVLLRLAVKALFDRSPAAVSRPQAAPAGWERPPIPHEPAPRLGRVERVIPIALNETVAGVEIALLSLECSAEGFYLNGRYSAKYGEIGHDNIYLALPVMTARDDLGTTYRWWPQGDSRGRFACVFAPALDPSARQLELTVTEMRWTWPRSGRRELDTGPWRFTVSVRQA